MTLGQGKDTIDWQSEWNSFRDGSMDAFRRIYDSFFNKLFVYGAKMVSDTSLLEDCIHELFLTLYTRRGYLSSTSNLEFYLLKALKLTIYNKQRKNRKFLALDELGEVTFNLEFLVDVEEQETLSSETIELVKQTLEALTPGAKEILYLKFYSNLNYNEIGKIVGIQPDSVKKQVYRTISRLREILDAQILNLFVICSRA